MPYLSPDDRKRLLGPTGQRCTCGQPAVRDYCRSCDEFFLWCCNREHLGHRTYITATGRLDLSTFALPVVPPVVKVDFTVLEAERLDTLRQGDILAAGAARDRTIECPACQGSGDPPAEMMQRHGLTPPRYRCACCRGLGRVPRNLAIRAVLRYRRELDQR